ncbi:MAG: FG-GAP repeat domain-containing protein [Planctomycetota bacterium]
MLARLVSSAAALIVVALASSPLLAQRWFADTDRELFPRDLLRVHELYVIDINGDGFDDVAVGSASFGSFYFVGLPVLYLGNGDGTFRTELSTRAFFCGLGDVDGDGDLDILGTNSVLQNVGGPLTFGPGSFDMMTSKTAVLDLDGDNRADVLTSTQVLHSVVSGGQLTYVRESGRLPAATASGAAIAAGDFDGDGDDDAIWNGLLLQNGGTGFFTDVSATNLPAGASGMADYAVADIDADGDLDLVGIPLLPGMPILLQNDGTGRFADISSVLQVAADDWAAVATLDADGDGDVDLALGSRNGGVLLRNVGGTFQPWSTFGAGIVSAIAAIDTDGDGDLDLLTGSGSADHYLLSWGGGLGVRTWYNDGSGRYTSPRRGDLDRLASRRTAVADFDGDGDPDVLACDGGGWLLRNDGRGRFDAVQLGGMPTGRPTVADIDGNGQLEVAIVGVGSWSLLTFNGTSFTVQANIAAPGLTELPSRFGDVDGDGLQDLVLPNALFRQTAGSPAFAFVDASAQLGGSIIPDTSVALGDLDGDGDLDIVGGGAHPWLRINGGAGVFTPSQLQGQGDGRSLVVEPVDLDGDGDLDLVCANGCRGDCFPSNDGPWETYHLNDGLGNFALHQVQNSYFTHTETLAIGDVDGDGDPDCVFGNRSPNHPGDAMVWNELPVNMRYSQRGDALPIDSQGATDQFLADFDGDGDLDLLTLMERQHALYANLTRHLLAPLPLRSGRDYPLEVHGALGGAAILVGAAPSATAVPPFGTLGIDPAALWQLALLGPPTSGRMVGITVPIPELSALRGVQFYVQALLDDGAGALRLTNTLADTLETY